MAIVTIMATSQYRVRIEEDLIEWCAFLEVPAFLLKDIDFHIVDFRPCEK